MLHLPNGHRAMRLSVILWLIAIIISALMTLLGGIRAWGQEETQDSRILTMQERHLDNTDANVSALTSRLDTLSNQVSQMQGEEYAAWAFLTLVSSAGLGITVSVRRKMKE